MQITITAFGETEMARNLLRFKERAEDMRPAFDEIHRDFLEMEGKQFQGQGVFSGGWEPLAMSTLEAKRRLGIDPRIMFGPTGDLFSSLTTSTDPNHIYRTTMDEMFIGSAVDYGRYHQSRQPRHRLPRRPLVELSEYRKDKWVKLLQEHIVGVPG
jgi:hypothetical protein